MGLNNILNISKININYFQKNVSQLVAQKNLMSTSKSVSASSGFDQTPIGQVVIEELAYAVPSGVRLGYI